MLWRFRAGAARTKDCGEANDGGTYGTWRGLYFRVPRKIPNHVLMTGTKVSYLTFIDSIPDAERSFRFWGLLGVSVPDPAKSTAQVARRGRTCTILPNSKGAMDNEADQSLLNTYIGRYL